MLKKGYILLLFFCFCSNYICGQNPNDAELANQFYINGEYDKSLLIYQKLYQSKGGAELYYNEYINTLLKLKKFTEAEKITLKKVKENFKYGIDLGKIYLEQGEVDKANKTFDSVIEDMPKDVYVITDVANSFYSLGNFEYAIKAFLTGRKLLKNDSIYGYELVNLYRYKRLKPELTTEVINILENQPAFLASAKSSISRTYETSEDYDVLKSIILKKVQKDPQNTTYINLLAWVYLQQKQYELALIQLIALDKRFEDNGSSIFNFANILVEEKAYDAAVKAYQYLIEKPKNSPYYIPARVAILKCKSQKINNEAPTQPKLAQLALDYEKLLDEFGKNNQTVFAIRELANLKALYLNDVSNATELLEQALTIPQINPSVAAQIKLDLATIYINNNLPWEAALLYGQVEKAFNDHPLGQKAKYRNAKLSFYNGDFNWAKAQLDVLKASTSQLIANDALDLSLLIQDNLNSDSTGNALKFYAKADLLHLKKQYYLAINTLDSIGLLFPQSDLADDVFMLKAKIYIETKNYQEAKTNLLQILERHNYSIWADDALYTLAVIEEDYLNDAINAKSHYEQLINQFPGSLFVLEARKRYRILRGDAL